MPRGSIGWRNWVLAVLMLAVVANALWKLSPWAFGVFAVVAASVAIRTLIERCREQKLGYWVEHLSPGQLRGRDNEIAVVYHEGDNEIVFSGIERSRPNRSLIYVPGAEVWDRSIASWASGRRSEILGRLLKDRIVKRHKIVESRNS